jgi:hypothetical protein
MTCRGYATFLFLPFAYEPPPVSTGHLVMVKMKGGYGQKGELGIEPRGAEGEGAFSFELCQRNLQERSLLESDEGCVRVLYTSELGGCFGGALSEGIG